MKRSEIIRVLQEANKALDDYNNQGLSKAVTNDDVREINEIKKSLGQLVEKRAYAIGSPGRTCPSCNGSGRL